MSSVRSDVDPGTLGPHYGACSCGAVTVALRLTAALSAQALRQCTCDYCGERNGIFLSDPKGGLEIRSTGVLIREKQGADIADMLLCSSCQDLIGAVCEIKGALKGVLRAPLLRHFDQLPAPELSAPQTLSGLEKVARWDALWMPVTLEEEAGA